MRVVEQGTKYLIEGSNGFTQELTFCHRAPDGTFINGATNEEIVDIMIHRFTNQVLVNDSVENIQSLLFFKQIRQHLSNRNTKKLKRRKDDNSRDGLSVSASSGTGGYKKGAESGVT